MGKMVVATLVMLFRCQQVLQSFVALSRRNALRVSTEIIKSKQEKALTKQRISFG